MKTRQGRYFSNIYYLFIYLAGIVATHCLELFSSLGIRTQLKGGRLIYISWSGNELLIVLGWKHILHSSFVKTNRFCKGLLITAWCVQRNVDVITSISQRWFSDFLVIEIPFSSNMPQAGETCWVIPLSCTLHMPRLLLRWSSKYGWTTFSASSCLIASYITERRCHRFQLVKLPHAG